jgi:hypothetical protein
MRRGADCVRWRNPRPSGVERSAFRVEQRARSPGGISHRSRVAGGQRGTDGVSCGRAGSAAKKLHLVVPASPDSGAQARGSPRGVGGTWEDAVPNSALGSPASSLAPAGHAEPETIQITVQAITVAFQGQNYRTEPTNLVASLVSAAQTNPPPAPPEFELEERSIAAKVFALLSALDPVSRLRKATPLRVFNLYYRQRLQPAEIARICKCDRSLIFDRLASIRASVPWTPEQLHEVSPHVEAMEEAFTDSRAREIRRQRAVYGDEPGD